MASPDSLINMLLYPNGPVMSSWDCAESGVIFGWLKDCSIAYTNATDALKLAYATHNAWQARVNQLLAGEPARQSVGGESDEYTTPQLEYALEERAKARVDWNNALATFQNKAYPYAQTVVTR